MFPKKEINWVGDKNPVYSIYLKRFIKIFPEARFICIIRDYRDNFISMKGLSDLNLEADILSLQVTRWRYVVKSFLRCKKKFPKRFYILRYEDLVQNQEEVFRELCKFLTIPYDPIVFDFFKKKDELVKIFPIELLEKYHKSLMKPINTGRMDLWKTALNENQVRTADQIAGKYADQVGYEGVHAAFAALPPDFPWVVPVHALVEIGWRRNYAVELGSSRLEPADCFQCIAAVDFVALGTEVRNQWVLNVFGVCCPAYRPGRAHVAAGIERLACAI